MCYESASVAQQNCLLQKVHSIIWLMDFNNRLNAPNIFVEGRTSWYDNCRDKCIGVSEEATPAAAAALSEHVCQYSFYPILLIQLLKRLCLYNAGGKRITIDSFSKSVMQYIGN